MNEKDTQPFYVRHGCRILAGIFGTAAIGFLAWGVYEILVDEFYELAGLYFFIFLLFAGATALFVYLDKY